MEDSWYYKNKDKALENNRNWRNENRKRVNEVRKKYRKKNVELTRARARKYYYAHHDEMKVRSIRRHLKDAGVSEKEIVKALSARTTFTGVCQACGTNCSCRYDTDHCHSSKKFRGIIGATCNKVLGLTKDSPQRLRALANYLEVFQNEQS